MKATDKICNRTYKALQLLYKNARDQQYNFLIGKQYPSIYSLGYKKEFCTIRICTARQTGHTTAILKFIANKKDTLPSVILAHNAGQRTRILKLMQEINLEERPHDPYQYVDSLTLINKSGMKTLLSTSCTIDKGEQYNIDYGFVFVDCASFVSKNQQEHIYNSFLNGKVIPQNPNYCSKEIEKMNFPYKFFIFME